METANEKSADKPYRIISTRKLRWVYIVLIIPLIALTLYVSEGWLIFFIMILGCFGIATILTICSKNNGWRHVRLLTAYTVIVTVFTASLLIGFVSFCITVETGILSVLMVTFSCVPVMASALLYALAITITIPFLTEKVEIPEK